MVFRRPKDQSPSTHSNGNSVSDAEESRAAPTTGVETDPGKFHVGDASSFSPGNGPDGTSFDNLTAVSAETSNLGGKWHIVGLPGLSIDPPPTDASKGSGNDTINNPSANPKGPKSLDGMSFDLEVLPDDSAASGVPVIAGEGNPPLTVGKDHGGERQIPRYIDVRYLKDIAMADYLQITGDTDVSIDASMYPRPGVRLAFGSNVQGVIIDLSGAIVRMKELLPKNSKGSDFEWKFHFSRYKVDRCHSGDWSPKLFPQVDAWSVMLKYRYCVKVVKDTKESLSWFGSTMTLFRTAVYEGSDSAPHRLAIEPSLADPQQKYYTLL
ncbi:hypothetical protein QFC21_004850 [Naganishia friedmannii]|uniref:Uncharacterized protein n=1 Tax=Naganishia friedmannii TaxID=89922 RepID=A0ACC2VEY9_9TREE|nr:hypothetical protein QFC21_004850 [Naganishia friedmannii]